jgi:hypothetical protein
MKTKTAKSLNTTKTKRKKVYDGNLKTGENPVTNKEFLVIHKVGKRLVVDNTTYQTRRGADEFRPSNGLATVVEKTRVIDHMKKFKAGGWEYSALIKYLPKNWEKEIRYR